MSPFSNSSPNGNAVTPGAAVAPASDKPMGDAPGEQLVTLPFFLGKRTASQFRRLFSGVLLLSLPLTLGTLGQQYITQQAAIQKIAASSTMTSDMRYLAKAADLVLRGNTTVRDPMNQRANALGKALVRLELDPVLYRMVLVREEEAQRVGKIAQLIARAQRHPARSTHARRPGRRLCPAPRATKRHGSLCGKPAQLDTAEGERHPRSR